MSELQTRKMGKAYYEVLKELRNNKLGDTVLLPVLRLLDCNGTYIVRIHHHISENFVDVKILKDKIEYGFIEDLQVKGFVYGIIIDIYENNMLVFTYRLPNIFNSVIKLYYDVGFFK